VRRPPVASGDVLELLLPQRCVVCRAPGAQACSACVVALPRLRPPLCERCGAPTAWPVRRCRECAGRRVAFATARAALVYDDRVRALVAAWKELGLRKLAATAADVVAVSVPVPAKAQAIVPVPPDRTRELKRGHHPAARLGAELARRWELPLIAMLRRPRAARPQRGLSSVERRRNVTGSFVALDRSPAHVVLVDDVYTTGATASAAASALRKAGARRVDVVTLARTSRTG
jgi:ComF family protein